MLHLWLGLWGCLIELIVCKVSVCWLKASKTPNSIWYPQIVNYSQEVISKCSCHMTWLDTSFCRIWMHLDGIKQAYTVTPYNLHVCSYQVISLSSSVLHSQFTPIEALWRQTSPSPCSEINVLDLSISGLQTNHCCACSSEEQLKSD